MGRDTEEYIVTIEPDRRFSDDLGSGWLIRETWRKVGEEAIQRPFGPPIIIRHPLSHVAIEQHYVDELGRLDCVFGPAKIYSNYVTGEEERVEYYREGILLDSLSQYDNSL